MRLLQWLCRWLQRPKPGATRSPGEGGRVQPDVHWTDTAAGAGNRIRALMVWARLEGRQPADVPEIRDLLVWALYVVSYRLAHGRGSDWACAQGRTRPLPLPNSLGDVEGGLLMGPDRGVHMGHLMDRVMTLWGCYGPHGETCFDRRRIPHKEQRESIADALAYHLGSKAYDAFLLSGLAGLSGGSHRDDVWRATVRFWKGLGEDPSGVENPILRGTQWSGNGSMILAPASHRGPRHIPLAPAVLFKIRAAVYAQRHAFHQRIESQVEVLTKGSSPVDQFGRPLSTGAIRRLAGTMDTGTPSGWPSSTTERAARASGGLSIAPPTEEGRLAIWRSSRGV
jgi:hypothetical protein